MKLFFRFSILLLFFVFITFSFSYADNFKETYLIEVGKINIGKLFWNINFSENNYKISIILKNKGFLSGLYKFSGEYETSGFIVNENLTPLKYKQRWVTKRKKRNVEISFNNNVVTELILFPEEREYSRIEYIGIKNHFDPLSSFLNLLIGDIESQTIDGRRIYSLVVDKNNIEDNIITKKILVKDYVNIWTDHKRKDLEYIEIVQQIDENIISMPLIIKIKFKGFLFKLKKI